MNENINKGEITFQSIFALIKRSFVRIVVYVVIAAVVVGLCGTIVILVNKEEPTFKAIIEFNYAGAEDGLDPWGRRLDVTKIKADNIITKALEENFTQAERAKLKSKIKNNLSIAGIVPEDIVKRKMIINEIATKDLSHLDELNELSYNCTSFIVTLTNDKSMELDNKQCIDILNRILDTYIANFRATYGYNDVLGSLIAYDIDFKKYDYVEMFDVYNTQITDIIRFIDTLLTEAKGFRSTSNNLTFEDYKSRILSIRDYNIKALETYIFDKGIANEKATINVTTYIEEKLSNIEIEIEATEKLLEETDRAMTEIFEAYYNTKKDVNGNEEKYLANGEIYQQYHDNYMMYQTELVAQNTEKKLWTNRRNKFRDATDEYTAAEREEHRDEADFMIETINDLLLVEIDYINEAVDEYIETEVMKNSINKSVSAVKTNIETFDIKLLVIVVILAMFIAFVAALVVTSKKEKKVLASENIDDKTKANKTKKE